MHLISGVKASSLEVTLREKVTCKLLKSTRLAFQDLLTRLPNRLSGQSNVPGLCVIGPPKPPKP